MSRSALSAVSSHSRSASDDHVIPAPVPKCSCPSAAQKVLIPTASTPSPESASTQPTAPQYGPRGTGSRSAMVEPALRRAARRRAGRRHHRLPARPRGAASRHSCTTPRRRSATCAPTPTTSASPPTRIGVMGESAGGHLAALVGLTAHRRRPRGHARRRRSVERGRRRRRLVRPGRLRRPCRGRPRRRPSRPSCQPELRVAAGGPADSRASRAQPAPTPARSPT